MRNVIILAQWIFAVFVAIASYLCSLILFAVLFGRLQGLPWGAQSPPDFHSPLNPIVFWVAADIMVYLPLVVASYLGAIAAPRSQLRAASIVIPCLVFLLISFGPSLWTGRWGTSIQFLLEAGAACAIAAAFLYFRWKRQASSKSPMQNAPLMAGLGAEP
jgi:hypothetical protein